MKSLRNLILFLAALVVAACNDEPEAPHRIADFCVQAVWQNGLGNRHSRALTTTNILAPGPGDIVIDYADYPASIALHCSDGTDCTLTKSSSPCTTHSTFWTYTPDVTYRDNQIERDNLTFTAEATLDDSGSADLLTGECAFADLDEGHMLITLHHTKALLRFAFRVSEKYDKVRFIRLTGIEFNGQPCVIADKVLNKSKMTFIGYAYIDPIALSTATQNTIRCTYNIYDKDAVFPTATMTPDEINAAETQLLNHLDRKSVVAQNQFRLDALKDADNTPITSLRPGYYYDLRVTLNPDYLYVLAEHDNKHLVVE